VPSRSSKEARLGRYPNRNKKPDLGRTKSEIGFGKSQKAAGNAVSRTNLGKSSSSSPKPPKAPRARRNPLATPEVGKALDNIRKRYTPPGRTRSEQDLKDNMSLQTERNASERKLEDAALRDFPTRPEALAAEPKIRQNTRLNAEGTTVERYRGRRPVGTPRVGEATRAARDGKLRRDGKKFTTPEVRQTRRKVRRAKREVRRARAALQTPRKNLMRAGLDPEQARILTTVLKTGRKMGASQKEMLAATMTALVESNISNPTVMTDHDSLGWRQERVSQYGTKNALDVRGGARRFFEESVSDTGGTRGKGMLAGDLAQTIQGSAYPDRYEERRPEATALLRAFRSAGSGSPEAKARLEEAQRRAEGVAKKAGDLGLSTEGLVTPKEAKNLGIKPPDESGAPPKIVKAFKGMIAAAKDLEARQLPYVYGGGHGTQRVGDPSQYSGLDCSSTVSHILQQGGVDMPTIVSGDFGSYTKPGPGAVTILYNPSHVLMKIGDKYFGTSGTNPGGGPGWLDKSLGDSEMASGKYNIGHVPGLGPKIAKQMNLDPDSYRVFPGMSVSGNTATVTSGGTVSYTPTFSNSPIIAGDGPTGRKTRQQRIIGQLRELGYRVTPGGITKPEEKSSQPEETLSQMRERYGIK